VKRKTRKRPRCWQFLKECPMDAIGRIVIAAPSKVSCADPRLQRRLVEKVTNFTRDSMRALAEVSPITCLHSSPEQHIRLADAGIGNSDVVATNCRDADFLVIFGANCERAVIGFQHVTPVTIIRGKDSSLTVAKRSKVLGHCAIDDLDIQFLRSFDLKYTFRWARCHNCEVLTHHAAHEVSHIHPALHVSKPKIADKPICDSITNNRAEWPLRGHF